MSDLACTCYRLRKVTRRATALYDGALAPLGLTATQLSVMTMASAAGPCSVAQLAEALGMEESSLSRTLRPLLARGWLSANAAGDRRIKRISLTPRGEETLRAAIPLWRKAQGRIEKELGAEVAQLHTLLGRLDSGLAEAAG